ncbi:hypothetical protein PAPYR_3717 [Paratrimastix pyriformis]|uniref:Uncharacterized protein n=1 Tax=Paratrimastix pyriformis TaxID=342808 RepID=A0ABQ8UQL8_9EUKA|nr:hypothetical protein PAPYR_3717 [Paratrimastix pyriformis]
MCRIWGISAPSFAHSSLPLQGYALTSKSPIFFRKNPRSCRYTALLFDEEARELILGDEAGFLTISRVFANGRVVFDECLPPPPPTPAARSAPPLTPTTPSSARPTTASSVLTGLEVPSLTLASTGPPRSTGRPPESQWTARTDITGGEPGDGAELLSRRRPGTEATTGAGAGSESLSRRRPGTEAGTGVGEAEGGRLQEEEEDEAQRPLVKKLLVSHGGMVLAFSIVRQVQWEEMGGHDNRILGIDVLEPDVLGPCEAATADASPEAIDGGSRIRSPARSSTLSGWLGGHDPNLPEGCLSRRQTAKLLSMTHTASCDNTIRAWDPDAHTIQTWSPLAPSARLEAASAHDAPSGSPRAAVARTQLHEQPDRPGAPAPRPLAECGPVEIGVQRGIAPGAELSAFRFCQLQGLFYLGCSDGTFLIQSRERSSVPPTQPPNVWWCWSLACDRKLAGLQRWQHRSHSNAVSCIVTDCYHRIWTGGFDGMIAVYEMVGHNLNLVRAFQVRSTVSLHHPMHRSITPTHRSITRLQAQRSEIQCLCYYGTRRQAEPTAAPNASREALGPTWMVFCGATMGSFGPSGPPSACLMRCELTMMIIAWDAFRRCRLFTLTGHTGAVTALAVADDVGLLLSGSIDRTVRVWNPRTRSQIHGWPAHFRNPASTHRYYYCPPSRHVFTYVAEFCCLGYRRRPRTILAGTTIGMVVSYPLLDSLSLLHVTARKKAPNPAEALMRQVRQWKQERKEHEAQVRAAKLGRARTGGQIPGDWRSVEVTRQPGAQWGWADDEVSYDESAAGAAAAAAEAAEEEEEEGGEEAEEAPAMMVEATTQTSARGPVSGDVLSTPPSQLPQG